MHFDMCASKLFLSRVVIKCCYTNNSTQQKRDHNEYAMQPITITIRGKKPYQCEIAPNYLKIKCTQKKIEFWINQKPLFHTKD